MDTQQILKKLLEKNLGIKNWQIRKPPAGLSKESFIAKSGDKEVFIKFDANTKYLSRLSDLGIVPRIITIGEENDTFFLIQEYVHGISPSAKWFQNSFSEVAALIRKYHEDKILTELLKKDNKIETFHDLLKTFEKYLIEEKAKSIFTKLTSGFNTSSNYELTPVHPDPNKKNFLVDGKKIWIIDWDNIVLSDPLRDIGPICFWYLPKEKWQQFLQELGFNFNEDIINRIYWWTTMRSLEIYKWWTDKGVEKLALEYLADAKAAINKELNPHAKF